MFLDAGETKCTFFAQFWRAKMVASPSLQPIFSGVLICDMRNGANRFNAGSLEIQECCADGYFSKPLLVAKTFSARSSRAFGHISRCKLSMTASRGCVSTVLIFVCVFEARCISETTDTKESAGFSGSLTSVELGAVRCRCGDGFSKIRCGDSV